MDGSWSLLFIIALWALIYAFVIERRRRRDVTATEEKFKQVINNLEFLEQRLRTAQFAAPATAAAPTPTPEVHALHEPAASLQPSASVAAKSICTNCGAGLAPAAQFCIRCGTPVAAKSAEAPPAVTEKMPSAAFHGTPPTYAPFVAPKPTTPATGEKTAGATAPVAAKPATGTPASALAPPPPPQGPTVATPAAHSAVAAAGASSSAVTSRPAMAGISPASTVPPRTTLPAGGPIFSSAAKPAPKKRSRSFEEIVGTNWLPKLGVVILVVGVALLTATQWAHVTSFWGFITAWGRAAVVLLAGLALLAAGIRFERKARYKILGRAMIGGGWAMTFLLAYAIRHSPTFQILPSDWADLAALLAVAGAMVWHTLKYNSQTVTGIAFLLGFASVTINQDPPFNLLAGAILVAGMTVIVVRRQWFELEIFGILVSFGNHFYWLYTVYEQEGQRATFPHHGASVALVIVYWVIFRVSYLVRKISGKEQESVSTFAGLLNPILFLVVMKYQGFHPEFAWWLLLAMGGVEFILGQLPLARRRRAPFQALSSLGAALMVASVPFKFSGNSLEPIWLAGAEAFLLAGIFTRERLFRGFGLIISFLVALYALPFRVVPLAQQIANGQPHHSGQISLVLAAIAVALYVNAHITRLRWPSLFKEELEQQSLTALSFVASVFAVAAVYAYVPEHATAAVLALLVAWLSGTGRLFSIAEMTYEAHWVAAMAFIQVLVRDSSVETAWLRTPQRVLSYTAVAALLYLSSRFVRLSETRGKTLFSGAYAWAGTSLLTLLIWFQATSRAPWTVAVLWIILGLALSLIGHALTRSDLKWQAFALVLLSSLRSLTFNMNLTATWPHVTYRLVSVSAVALGIYLLARWAPLQRIRWIYTFLGTSLLAYLAFKEAPATWTAVFWIGLALVLALAARLWKDRPLLWQTHLLSALAAAWTLYLFYDPQYRGTRVQWISVGITAAALYALNWLTNIAAVVEDERISHAYPWAASLLLSWLAWYQLPANSLALAWGMFALLLFEFPDIARSLKIGVTAQAAANWRAQAYVALAGSFVRIFIANFNAVGWAPALLVVCLAAIYFFIYWELGRRELSRLEQSIQVEFLTACLGTATLAALARFELPDDAVVIGYAGLVAATLLVAWLMHRQVFLFQAIVMLGFTAVRISMNNFYHLQEQFGSSLRDSIWAIALLACAVPLAFQARKNSPVGPPRWFSPFALHPEQPTFFVPVALLTVLLFLKLSGGRITLAWGVEGLLVFILALWAKERSFRLTGLGLVLLAAGKIAFWDAWQFNDSRRFIALMAVGAILMALGYLYGRNREALRDYV